MSAPKVWSRFSVTKSDGSVEKLRIQDMPSDKLEEVLDFNMIYFAVQETFHKAAGVDKNPVALQECREFVSELFRDPTTHVSICCRDDNEAVGEILGVSSMSVMTRDDDYDMDHLQFKTEEWKQFFLFIEVQQDLFDVTEELNVDRSYDGRGVAVRPDYRGLGIATEFLKVRLEVCRDRGVPVTTAWMTSHGSQRAAEKAGWETAFQIPFAELAKIIGVRDDAFDGTPPFCKMMVARI